MLKVLFISVVSFIGLNSCAQKNNSPKTKKENKVMTSSNVKLDTATFGTGCFWCTEAVFQELEGVLKVTSGYSGGHVANPRSRVPSGRPPVTPPDKTAGGSRGPKSRRVDFT